MKPTIADFKKAVQSVKPLQRPAPWLQNPEGTAAALLNTDYVPAPYTATKVGNNQRPLLVPGAHDRIVQRALQVVLYPRWEAKLPLSREGAKGVEQAVNSLESYFKQHPQGTFWKADIQGFFPNINQAKALEQITHELSQPSDDPWLWKAITAAIKGAPEGLPTGSPLSPLVADTALLSMDRAISAQVPFYMRYVDDLLILGDSAQVEAAKTSILKHLEEFGLNVKESKTLEGSYPNNPISVLGHHFFGATPPKPAPAQLPDCLYLVEGGASAFGFPLLDGQKAPLRGISIAPGVPSWTHDPKTDSTVYSWNHFLKVMVNRCHPDALDLLVSNTKAEPSAWGDKLHELRDLFLHSELGKGLHDYCLRVHTGQVKRAYESNKGVLQEPALSVVRTLMLSTRIMADGKFPDNWEAEKSEYIKVRDSVQKGEYDLYHATISKLFKQDHALRYKGGNKLPPSMAYEDLVVNDKDPLNPTDFAPDLTR